ncbi:ParB N-terminal domain-containing protein, partial [Staphylococcus agnetis]
MPLSENIVQLNLEEIRPNPYQPRQHFDQDKLAELATSIQQHGV